MDTGAKIAMLNILDLAVVAGYLLIVVTLGLGVYARERRKKLDCTASGYFLAGRSIPWPIVGTALFATNISCVHLVSLAQAGYDTGLVTGNFEWMAAFTLLTLAIVFAPVYLRSGAATLPDFLEMRYDRACRDWLTLVSITSAVVIHIGFAFVTGGRIVAMLFPEVGGMYPAIVFIAVLTGLYTILGGLLSVVVTETLQTLVLIFGAAFITAVTYSKVGGWHVFTNTLYGIGGSAKLSMLRSSNDPSGMPWYAVVLGYPVLGIWYWCADQTIVQRVLGARDANHARAGALFCAVLKIFPVFIFVMPGLFAYALAATGKLDLSSLTHFANGVRIIDSKDIYSVMITQLLPEGLRGLVVAALLAALMSSTAGALNSIATLASFDLYKRFAGDVPEGRLVSVGRIAGIVALVLSVALVPLLDRYASLFAGMNDIISHIAPPITTVFLLGVLWKRADARSARWTLWLGSALGAGVFLFNKLEPTGPLAAIPFLMMAFYLFVACVLLQAGLVLAGTRSSNPDPILVWANPTAAFREHSWRGIADYRFLSGMLVAIYAALYWGFA